MKKLTFACGATQLHAAFDPAMITHVATYIAGASLRPPIAPDGREMNCLFACPCKPAESGRKQVDLARKSGGAKCWCVRCRPVHAEDAK